MLLSTGISTLLPFGEDEAFRLVAEAGFDAIDFSFFTPYHNDDFFAAHDPEVYAREMKEKMNAVGLVCNQAHAPFRHEGAGTEAGLFRVERTVRMAGIMGAKSIVVHPFDFCSDLQEKKERNLEMFRRLCATARAYGTKIAMENFLGWDAEKSVGVPVGFSFAEEVCDYYDSLNEPDAFCVLLDVGHAALVGESPENAIRILGRDRLQGLHIQDNHAHKDVHSVPYDHGCELNWEAITAALGEIDYQGDFTYEADGFQNRFNPENIHIAMKFMEQMGRNLMAKIDAHRPH